MSKKGYSGHIIFLNEAKSCDRHTLVDIKPLCKFGEFMFIIEGGMKPFVKHDRHGDAQTEDIQVVATRFGRALTSRSVDHHSLYSFQPLD